MVKDLFLHILVSLQSIQLRATDEEGQTLAEYGLIMAVIAVAVVSLAAIAFRGAIVSAFQSATACLSGSC